MKRLAGVIYSHSGWVLSIVACLGLAASAADAARAGRGPGIRQRGALPVHRHSVKVPDGVYGATVRYSLGTISERWVVQHHHLVEIDTSGNPNAAGCFQNDPSTGNNTPIGPLTSFKVRIDPPAAFHSGTAHRLSSPYLATGLPIPLGDVIEAIPPVQTSLPLTHVHMWWEFTYSPGNFLFPIYHNTTIRGPRVVGSLGVNLEWGDYSNGGIACAGGDLHLLLRRPPLTYPGDINGR